MNIEAYRKTIIHKILDIENESLLSRIDAILNEETYAYSISGKPLSVNEYNQEINSILEVAESKPVYTSEEIKKKIFKK
jgi:hypothetical protein